MKPAKRNKPITAAELMQQLQRDPEYLARIAAQDEEHRLRVEKGNTLTAPILDDLKQIGYEVQSLDALRRTKKNYKSAIPVLLRWLPRIENSKLKQSIVRTLSVPWANPEAIVPLINEFKKTPNSDEKAGLKWAIGNALAVIADDSILDEIISLSQDKEHGKAREMVVLSLSNMKDDRAVDVLVDLLNDDQVCGHAIMALGKLRASKVYPKIEMFLNHPKKWISEEARKALVKIPPPTKG